jgi:Domain of unknown function (DUF4301)
VEFSTQELAQIEKRGSQASTVLYQISNFENGFPFIDAKKAATIESGIVRLDDKNLQHYISFFETKASKKKLLKFVPASGAASRMFKSLYAAKDEAKADASVEQFFAEINKFAFASKLNIKASQHEVLSEVLTEKNLNYGNLPKGLIDFHFYADGVRTAIEEHLVEGALYANSKGKVRLHFTVSPEHKTKFKALLKNVIKKYEEKFSVKFSIDFSEQKPGTDTIAVDSENKPFRDAQNRLLFRPAGHGALLENLNDLDADLIFIKNIDNVVPDHLKAETIAYKKALAGIVFEYQQQIFSFLRKLESDAPSTFMLRKVLKFLREKLFVEPPKGFRAWSKAEKLAYALRKLKRPLRVCGMVQNVGEPGGGPFWIQNADGSQSLQIVESAQFDLNNKKQAEIFKNSTHFNPVDLICATKNRAKEKYNLIEFRDPNTGFITEKSQGGKVLKAQELPGLWNGSMANWNTVFVEVPLITFNPVKTVNDLLRKEHQGG